MTCFALKGNILYCKTPEKIVSMSDSYVICERCCVIGVFRDLPIRYANIPVIDCGSRLIVPGFTDLHLHASQFAVRGIGMEAAVTERIQHILMREEANFFDIWHAQRAYPLFVDALTAGATTRACIFATIHLSATKYLMDLLEASGLRTMVGKVNMDRECPGGVCESSAEAALDDTREWIAQCLGRYRNTSMILTPRIQCCCSDELLRGLGVLQRETNLPVQTHFSTIAPDIKWYDNGRHSKNGLLEHRLLGGSGCRTVISHCARADDRELALLHKLGAFVAHCPEADMYYGLGVSPVKKLYQRKIPCGLGTDIALGSSMSIFRAITEVMRSSWQYSALVDDSVPPLTFAEAFYMATAGGGAFFNNVGSFLPGYEFDAVVIDDSNFADLHHFTLIERLERAICLCDERNVVLKYVAGTKVKDLLHEPVRL